MEGKKEKIVLVLLIAIFIAMPVIYKVVIKPKNAIELYQTIQFSDGFKDIKSHINEGYNSNVPVEIYDEIKNSTLSPEKVRQFTVLEYANEMYLIETSPGTTKLKILGLDKAPEEVRDYISELNNIKAVYE